MRQRRRTPLRRWMIRLRRCEGSIHPSSESIPGVAFIQVMPSSITPAPGWRLRRCRGSIRWSLLSPCRCLFYGWDCFYLLTRHPLLRRSPSSWARVRRPTSRACCCRPSTAPPINCPASRNGRVRRRCAGPPRPPAGHARRRRQPRPSRLRSRPLRLRRAVPPQCLLRLATPTRGPARTAGRPAARCAARAARAPTSARPTASARAGRPTSPRARRLRLRWGHAVSTRCPRRASIGRVPACTRPVEARVGPDAAG